MQGRARAGRVVVRASALAGALLGGGCDLVFGVSPTRDAGPTPDAGMRVEDADPLAPDAQLTIPGTQRLNITGFASNLVDFNECSVLDVAGVVQMNDFTGYLMALSALNTDTSRRTILFARSADGYNFVASDDAPPSWDANPIRDTPRLGREYFGQLSSPINLWYSSQAMLAGDRSQIIRARNGATSANNWWNPSDVSPFQFTQPTDLPGDLHNRGEAMVTAILVSSDRLVDQCLSGADLVECGQQRYANFEVTKVYRDPLELPSGQLYFARADIDGGQFDIYTSTLNEETGQFLAPTLTLQLGQATTTSERFPYLAENGNFYFSLRSQLEPALDGCYVKPAS
jgi:hypothetical protein